MLEVVFSDSAKGAMKVAKHYKKNSMCGGSFGYIGEKPSKAELKTAKAEMKKHFEGEAVGGDSRDVVCIGCNLDIGDISDENTLEKRKKEFVRVFGSVDFEEEEMENFFRLQYEDLEKLLAAAKNGQEIRVWKSNAPFSACGFAFLCEALKDIDCPLSVISLPEQWENADGTMRFCTDWAELPPGQLYRFLPLERAVSNQEKQWQSNLWQALKKQNAPLRAVVSGKLISVPEAFYDHIIRRNIPENDFLMGRLIGEILGNTPLGVGDGWYALRIKKMIEENELEVVAEKDSSHPYGKVLRRISI